MNAWLVENQNAWSPRTDVIETEQGYELHLDLPGLKREDLDIQVESGILSVKGERKLGAKPQGYYWVERPHGSFSRVFQLPEFVNHTAIEARLADGVLNLTLPKREESKPKQITVQVQ